MSKICKLVDKYGRIFRYLRLSITDVCNFKCCYCLPLGYRKSRNYNSFLSLYEIHNLIDTFCLLGLEKVRISGGEPTLRNDFFKIGKLISSYNCINVLAFTTNGYKLKRIALKCRDSGYTHVNVSIDSLVQKNFFLITGQNLLSRVLDGLEESLIVGFCVKINVVFLRSFSIYDFDNFLDFILSRNVSIRFIELVGTRGLLDFFLNNYSSLLFLRCYLERCGWKKGFLERNAGPAVVYFHRDYCGSIGFISSYSANFCFSCNRLRVSAIGEIYLCLFGGREKVFSIREYISSFEKKSILKDVLQRIIYSKELSHFLLDGTFGSVNQLSEIGG